MKKIITLSLGSLITLIFAVSIVSPVANAQSTPVTSGTYQMTSTSNPASIVYVPHATSVLMSTANSVSVEYPGVVDIPTASGSYTSNNPSLCQKNKVTKNGTDEYNSVAGCKYTLTTNSNSGTHNVSVLYVENQSTSTKFSPGQHFTLINQASNFYSLPYATSTIKIPQTGIATTPVIGDKSFQIAGKTWWQINWVDFSGFVMDSGFIAEDQISPGTPIPASPFKISSDLSTVSPGQSAMITWVYGSADFGQCMIYENGNLWQSGAVGQGLQGGTGSSGPLTSDTVFSGVCIKTGLTVLATTTLTVKVNSTTTNPVSTTTTVVTTPAPVSVSTSTTTTVTTPTTVSTTTSVGTTTPPTTACYLFTQNLTLGTRSPDVAALQVWLIAHGYNIHGLTTTANAKGYFGTQTQQALKQYQTAVGLPVTGNMDVLTRAKINGSCGGPVVATSTPTNFLTISNTSASKGPLVTNSSNTSQSQNVTFGFTLTAGNSPIFISTSVTDTANLAPNSSIVFNAKGFIVPAKGSLSTNLPSTADTADHFYIAPGTSRQFTFVGLLTNDATYGAVNGVNMVKVASINYGTTGATNLSEYSITSSLDNLQIVSDITIGNNPTTPTCPIGYTCVPQGSSSFCPVGYTCTAVTINCPSGYTCQTISTSTQPYSFNVTYPTVGATLQVGQNYNVKWDSSDPLGSSYAVYLVGGNLGQAAATYLGTAVSTGSKYTDGTGSVGVFPWTIGSNVTAASSYQIQFSAKGASGGSSPSFTIVSATSTSQPPVISGGTFPTTLTVGQQGTWTVNASDPQNGSLSYSVDWGDTSTCPPGYACAVASAKAAAVQSSTFTHSYSTTGTYTVTFTVTNSAGLSAKTTTTVQVGSVVKPTPTPIPVITPVVTTPAPVHTPTTTTKPVTTQTPAVTTTVTKPVSTPVQVTTPTPVVTTPTQVKPITPVVVPVATTPAPAPVNTPAPTPTPVVVPTPKPIVKPTIVTIPATKTATCPAGYKLGPEGLRCRNGVAGEAVAPTQTYTCPDSYTLNSSDNTCSKQVSDLYPTNNDDLTASIWDAVREYFGQ